jgi:hypothetical protein
VHIHECGAVAAGVGPWRYGEAVVASIDRLSALGFRVRAQQLDRERGTLPSTAVLDIGAQDTGPDGALWALALRGVDTTKLTDGALVLAWTIRGAPHMYRRKDLPAIAAAVAPYSDVDAGKRIFDAAKPLRAAGIGNLEDHRHEADGQGRDLHEAHCGDG